MAVHESKVRAGELTLDGQTYSCQPTSVAIQPGSDSGAAGDALEVLCGDKLTGGASGDSLTADLVFTAIQDFDSASGLIPFSWLKDGKTVPFSWRPTSSSSDTWTGEVTVKALEVGGTVGERLTSQATWTITKLTLPVRLGGTQVIPQIAPATKGAAGAGDKFPTEGTVTASDSQNAGKLAGLGFVANPLTAWTTGQSIFIGPTLEFHWDGTAWAAGKA